VPRREDVQHRVKRAVYEELSPLFRRLTVDAYPLPKGGWKAKVEALSKGAPLGKLSEIVPEIESRLARQFELGRLKVDIKLDRELEEARELFARFLRGWRVREVSYTRGDPPEPSCGVVTIENPEISGPKGRIDCSFRTHDEMLDLIEEASGYMPHGKQARESGGRVSKA
jgi:hypothetical protein